MLELCSCACAADLYRFFYHSFTAEQLSKINYEAESPDEAALVYAAHAYGCVLAHRSSSGGRETVTITLPNGEGTMMFEVRCLLFLLSPIIGVVLRLILIKILLEFADLYSPIDDH